MIIQETDWIKRGPHQQHHLFERLVEMGHEIIVLDYNYLWDKKSYGFQPTVKHIVPGKVVKGIKIKVITPWMLKFPILNRISIIPSTIIHLIKLIKYFKPDIIINFGILNAAISTTIGKINGIPVIYYLIDHLHLLLDSKMEQIIAKSFEIYNIKMSDAIFTINEGLIQYTKNLANCDLEKVHLIKGGVDFNKYQTAKKQRNEIRREYNIKENERVLFFMGWIYDFSRLNLIAHELISQLEKYKDMILMVVGDGDAVYQELIKISKVNKNKIIITGRVDFEDIPKLIAIADICILPNERKNIMENIVPIKLYEYLASGKPVISTFLPGVVKEFGYEAGIFYIKTIDELLTLSSSITTDRLLEEGLKAQNFARKSDWQNIIDSFLMIIHHINNRKN